MRYIYDKVQEDIPKTILSTTIEPAPSNNWHIPGMKYALC